MQFLISISDGEEPPHFHPEFGRFMLEATPGRPWGIGFKDLLKVESNMKWRLVALLIHITYYTLLTLTSDEK